MDSIVTAYISYNCTLTEAKHSVSYRLNASGINAYTLIPCIGYHEGNEEDSLQLIVVCSENRIFDVRYALYQIGKDFLQNTILCTVSLNGSRIEETILEMEY